MDKPDLTSERRQIEVKRSADHIQRLESRTDPRKLIKLQRQDRNAHILILVPLRRRQNRRAERDRRHSRGHGGRRAEPVELIAGLEPGVCVEVLVGERGPGPVYEEEREEGRVARLAGGRDGAQGLGWHDI